jgi:GMP synthase-like glutamine amidotransferase
MSTCLVVENDPTSGPGHFAEWLTDGGLAQAVVRVYAGEPLPDDLAGYAAFMVLGGDQHAYPDADGSPGEAWFPALEALLRQAVRDQVPTLGVCLGAQLLATALGGTVDPAAAGPEIGPGLVAKRDAAESDPLFGPLPMLPDVLQWHHDEITELPRRAVLLAASTGYAVQAFRVGPAAWGVQFHPELDLGTLTGWVATAGPLLASLGIDGDALLARAAALQDDLFEVWHPFATRFAALARGELTPPARDPVPGRGLPLLGASGQAEPWVGQL